MLPAGVLFLLFSAASCMSETRFVITWDIKDGIKDVCSFTSPGTNHPFPVPYSTITRKKHSSGLIVSDIIFHSSLALLLLCPC